MAAILAVGINVAKASFDAAFVDEQGRAHHKQFSNQARGFAHFTQWLKKQGIAHAHICMEATGSYSYAFGLHPRI